VVLCYLDGRSTEDAAKQLCVPRGTVLSRLATARKKLAERLTRRGITAALAAALAAETVTANAVETCTATALRFAAGIGGTGVSIQLAERVLRMGTRLKLAGWALAIVMVAGLGTGVGVVAGTTPQGVGEAKKPDPPPATKAADPPKVATEVKRESRLEAQEREERQRREIDRHDRITKLDMQARKLQEVIAKQMDQLGQLHRDAAAQVDAKALQAALVKADDAILVLEGAIETAGTTQAVAQEKLGAVSKLVPSDDQIEVHVQSRVDFHQALNEYRKASEALDKLRKTVAAGSPILGQAEKDQKEKSDKLTAVRTAARPEAEKAWREEQALALRNLLASRTSYLAETEKRLKAAVQKRRQLAERYAQAKQTADRVQLIEDELKVYREVRQVVIRQRLMLEIGLDDK
jgi:hypothetical protein